MRSTAEILHRLHGGDLKNWERAESTVDRDDVVVYDACANIGALVGNEPKRALVEIVYNFMEDGA